MHAPLQAALTRSQRAKGESSVWLTAMGLGLGLLMVVYLLWLIVSQGLAVFWPKAIVELELRPGSKSGINEAPRFAGAIAKIQKRRVQVVREDGTTPEDPTEWQIFVGNRDAYGFSFKYIDFAEVAKTSYPKEILRVERLEYGDAIGYPTGLKLSDARILAPHEAAFAGELRTLVREANKRRHEIEKIEKREIGSINATMERLRTQIRNLEAGGDTDELKKAQESRAKLQAEYEELAARAKQLREQQGTATLMLRLATGEERPTPVGSIVSYYYPNQLDTLAKAGVFLQRVWHFVSDDPREANTEGGIFPAIFGTFVMTLIMSLAVTPFGVLAAIYLREYAVQGLFVRSVRIAINNLAGVPSIVFGVFGLGFFVYTVGGTIDQLFFKDVLPTPTFGTGGILWCSLTLALMTVPVVIVATEEALAAVPRGVREGALACGASKWQTIERVVLPASSSGILTGLILAMARGAGEVAPLMLVGVVKLAPSLPLDDTAPFVHLDRKFMHLGFHIYDLGFQSPDSEAAKPMVFATTLLLILLVVVLNIGAIFIRERLRRKYATGAF
jgi:phosphate transport system permease protein